MAAPTMEERKACWGARDEFWQCLDSHGDDAAKCEKLRRAFESRCPQQWVSTVSASLAAAAGWSCCLGMAVPASCSAQPGAVRREPCSRVRRSWVSTLLAGKEELPDWPGS